MTETIIYGGAFNPPTLAHEAVIEHCIEHSNGGEVWLMPSADRFDKKFIVAPEHRVAMLKIIQQRYQDIGKVVISRLELEELPKPTQTYATYQHLLGKYPERRFRFVLGSDAYEAMPSWHNGAWLQATMPMMVMPRNGVSPLVGENAFITRRINTQPLSSTEVRVRLNRGLSTAGFLSEDVAGYIAAHQLYRL